MAQTWRLMLQRADGPSVIAMSQQSIDSALVSKYIKDDRAAKGVPNGCYVLNEAQADDADADEKAQSKPDVVVMANRSEVELALAAAEAQGRAARASDATPLEYRAHAVAQDNSR